MSPVIEIHNLVKKFRVSGGFLGLGDKQLTAVDHVSLSINKGETLGLVGESGSGKSTVGNCILRLMEPGKGKVLFKGQDILTLNEKDFNKIRGKLSIVFQDPQSSLDPRMTVRKIVGYPLGIQKKVKGKLLEKQVADVLKDVGLSPEHMDRYPHEFSGGQRQRIGIARALITRPEFIVFDEPTSALDVSVQAQILNLVADLQKRYGYTYLFISHDLAVVRHISTRIAIMYLGAIVETASKNRFFENPAHPYTRALIASIPRPDPFVRQDMAVLSGDVPSPVNLPSGCRFHPRCPEAMNICSQDSPPTIEIKKKHFVNCHLYA